MVIELRYPKPAKVSEDPLWIAGWKREDDFHYQFRTRIRNRAVRAVAFGLVHRAVILRRQLAVPRLESYELLPRGMHAAYACASSRVAFLPSHPPAIPLAVFLVTLRATIPRSWCSIFKPVFKKAREKSPQATSIIDTSTERIPLVFPLLSASSSLQAPTLISAMDFNEF